VGAGIATITLNRPEALNSLTVPMKVELLEGIVGTDGAPLTPWTLTFSLGGG